MDKIDTPLISVIMAARNEERYIEYSIKSVLAQTYPNWELIIIDDGSSDGTPGKIKSFQDRRIQYYYFSARGVSAARNEGLQRINGDYFCFLDADDLLTRNSLAVRMRKFKKDPTLDFVDGSIEVRDETLTCRIRESNPTISGNSFNYLVRLSGKCFNGLTWLIKRNVTTTYRFKEGLTHGEDLLFYISIAQGRKYDYVNDIILLIRKRRNSTMSDFEGLGRGYQIVLHEIKKIYRENLSLMDVLINDFRRRKIMLLSYLSVGDFKSGVTYFLCGK